MENVKIIDQKLEDRIIKSLLEYEKLCTLVLPHLSSNDFSTTAKSKLYHCIKVYYEEFSEVPDKDMLVMTCEEVYNKDDAVVITRLLKRLDNVPCPTWSWILSKINTHINTIKLRKAIFESHELLENHGYEDTKNNLISVISQPSLGVAESNNYLDLSDDFISDISLQQESLVCRTRIYALDDHIQGLFREEAFLIMAPTNVGKSWAALHFACSGLMEKSRVLFFTLEMTKKFVLRRLLQNVSGTFVPRYETEFTRMVDLWDDDFILKSEEERPSLLATDKVKMHLDALRRLGGILDVKQYNDGDATVEDIERDVLYFDTVHGAPPDLIIVDGLLNFNLGDDGSKQRHVLSNISKRLRSIAVDYNCAVVATHQANREGSKKDVEIVGLEHTGESFNIVRTFDTAISLNQTKEENRLGEMRISVMRARNQRKSGYIRIYQNLEIGQFCQASVDIDKQKEEETLEDDS